MGRSVMTARNAEATIYLDFNDLYAPSEDYWDEDHFDSLEEAQQHWNSFEHQHDWDHFVTEDLPNVMQEVAPSFEKVDTWPEREVRAILENGHARITVSEYCGCVAVCLVPQDHDHYPNETALARAWTARFAKRFREHMVERFPSAMYRTGTMSNGVSVYRRIAA